MLTRIEVVEDLISRYRKIDGLIKLLGASGTASMSVLDGSSFKGGTMDISQMEALEFLESRRVELKGLLAGVGVDVG